VDITAYNREAWDRNVANGDRWTLPSVSGSSVGLPSLLFGAAVEIDAGAAMP
jgi:hypothetical protein